MGFSYGENTILVDSFGEVGGSGGQTTVYIKGMGVNISVLYGLGVYGF
jgi:hypothetical protein